MRCADKNIQRKRRVDGQTDLHGLVELIPARHDDEDIHIAVRVWLPIGVRAEQDNLVGVELLSDLAGKAANN